MPRIPAIANSLWLAASLPSFLQFRNAAKRPEIAQKICLNRAVSRNSNTAYGRAHGFGEIRNYRDFARKVPMVNYEKLEPWISRIVAGEQNVLTADRITHFIPTSGTCSGRKLIPFTGGLQQEFSSAIGPWVIDLYRADPRAVFGAAYWSITPVVERSNAEQSAVPIGFDEDSGYLGGAKKNLLSSVMAVPAEVRLIQDIAAFRYVTLLCLLRREDLSFVSVWHPSFLSLLLDAMPINWHELVRDVFEGKCKYDSDLPVVVRQAIGSRRLEQRARQLEQVGSERPNCIWPNLRVVSCWGDAHSEGPMRQLQQRLPGIRIQPKGLLATEAFVSFPLGKCHPLAIRSHFFEFLDDAGQVRLAHELRQGGEYEVLVTTSGGLYRYRLGDRVKMTAFVAKTPSLKFLGRNGIVSDRCGEKLSEAFVARAIAEVTSCLPEQPRFALLAPDECAEGIRYSLFIEAQVDENLGNRLDESLKQNPHYLYCRNLGQLLAPEVIQIGNRGFETYLSYEMARGKRMGNIKPCALSADVAWAKHFKSIIAKQSTTHFILT
jgi:hypothetical protein